MNHVEVWLIEEIEDIEDTVNNYCRKYNLSPISISATYAPTRCCWCVCVVVEQKEDQ